MTRPGTPRSSAVRAPSAANQALSYIKSKWPDARGRQFSLSLVLHRRLQPHFLFALFSFVVAGSPPFITPNISYFIANFLPRRKSTTYTMLSSLLATILLVLGFVAAAPGPLAVVPAAKLTLRQVSVTPSQTDLCLDYERTANMSTIGANSSYRTVLMQKLNVGTMFSARMMDAAISKLPPLTVNKDLNDKCGNWTQIALTEAERNFTMGIVAQFTTEGLPVGIKAGPEVAVIIGAICILFSVVWVFSG
jgi:hypothetical protein